MTPTEKDQISKGRAQIILRDPFFATILMDMEPVIDAEATETCGTDGDRLVFNPEWLAEAETPLVAAAMRKMALHAALSHPIRRRARDGRKWQKACDEAALHIMAQDGVPTPEGMTAAPVYQGKTAEEIYSLLPDDDGNNDNQAQGQGQNDSPGGQGQSNDPSGQGQQSGQGNGDQTPGQSPAPGHSMDNPNIKSEADRNEAQRKNDQRVFRAAMAEKACGEESLTAKRLKNDIRQSSVDWREKLDTFVDSRVDSDFSWSRPNRRFVHDDIYLPGQTPDGLSTMGVVIDTSGSIDDKTLARFIGQANAAREARMIEKTVVVYCDSKVKRIDTFEAGEEIVANPIGGGGTNMAPAMIELRQHDCNVVVCLTDGVFSDLTEDPQAPTLFCIYGGYCDRVDATFGESIVILAED